jgi:nitrite transporter NirC
MYQESVTSISKAAAAQVELIEKSLPAYIVHSMMAGAYLGLIVVMTFLFGGAMYQTTFEPLRGFVMAAVFGGALSLVIVAGSELFTGNNMIMTMGMLSGRVGIPGTMKVWTWSWVGNFLGSILVGAMAWQAGVLGGAEALLGTIGGSKMSMDLVPLFLRAMLCNWLVCLAVWSNFQLENTSAKLIMIWWCLLAFIGSGYEHSIANMTILYGANVAAPGAAGVSWAGMGYNLAVVTAGNMASGILFMGMAYYYISSSYGFEWDWSMDDNVVTGAVSDD